jgi:hypothetical protein
MSRYRLFQSPDGSVVRVRQGFSWQAFFVGSLTTLVRQLWWLAVLALVALYASGVLDGSDVGTRGVALGLAFGALCFLYMVFCGCFGNRWLVESLLRRGFRMIGDENGRHRVSRSGRAGTSPSH